jgi:nucleotide-binding universal stress UspA family protein
MRKLLSRVSVLEVALRARRSRAAGQAGIAAFDGSPAAERAIREAGGLLTGRAALVLVVWKEGLGFELVLPGPTVAGLPPAELDIRTALEVDRALAEQAQRLAQQGAAIAREAGFEADALAVADDVDTPVSETIVRVAHERDARAVVIGAHVRGRGAGAILGAITRDVIRHARPPVVVVHDEDRADEG